MSKLLLSTLIGLTTLISFPTSAQRIPRDTDDSIALSKITDLPEVNQLADKYRLNENAPVYINSKVTVEIKQWPGKHQKYYWLQVMKREIKGEPSVLLNFYVRRKTYAVRYFNPDKKELLSLSEWRKRMDQ